MMNLCPIASPGPVFKCKTHFVRECHCSKAEDAATSEQVYIYKVPQSFLKGIYGDLLEYWYREGEIISRYFKDN